MKKHLILIIAGFTLFSSCMRKNTDTALSLDQLYNSAKLPTTDFTIDAGHDTLLTGISGTKIHIKGNTFVDLQGNLIAGKVELKMKEAIEMKDIIMGNLTTTSNGEYLESGGMIYIDATSDNKPLAIAKSKSIDVSVPSDKIKSGMNLYTGITDDRTNRLNWINPENVIVSNQVSDSVIQYPSDTLPPAAQSAELKQEFSAKEKLSPPLKPAQYDSNSDTTLVLVFDTIDFPEFAQYKNVKFKVLEASEINWSDSVIAWNSMDMKKSEKPGIYRLTLGRIENNNLKEKKFKVTPVFAEGADFTAAMKEYEKKFATYEKKKKEIESEKIAKEQQRIKEEKKQIAAFEAEEKRRLELEKKQIAQFAAEKAKRKLELIGSNLFSMDANVSYVFSVKQLGWSNIDRLLNDPRTRPVQILTHVENKSIYDELYITMAFTKENIYLPGYEMKNGSFGFTHNDLEKPNLPIGAEATIIVTAYKDNVPYFTMKKITIKDQQELSLQLLPMTQDKIAEEIKSNI